jgi:hypothetical protein
MACRFAEAAPDGSANLVGASIDTFWVTEFPAQPAFYIAMRAIADDEELERTHKLGIRLTSPAGSQLGEMAMDFPLPARSPIALPELEMGTIFCIGQQFVAEEEGAYKFDISLDDEPIRELIVSVRRPPEATP